MNQEMQLTRAGLSYFARKHAFRQMESLGMLDGMTPAEREAFEADSLGQIAELSIAEGMMPVVTFLPCDDAMAAYEGSIDRSQTALS